MTRRRKAWGIGLAVLVLVGGFLLYEYWSLQPQRHFTEKPHPVLAEQPPAAERPVAAAEPEAEPRAAFNVLILGLDGRDHELLTRSDVMMLAHVNPVKRSVRLLSIPRDTRVRLPEIGETKINHAYVMGALDGGEEAGRQRALEAVSRFIGVPIHYHVTMNFDGFERFVDEIGGVDLTLPQPVGPLPAGPLHAEGELALDIVRERYSLPGGETDRQSNQAMVLRAVAEKLMGAAYLPKLPGLYRQLKDGVVATNFTESDLLSLALLYKDLPGSAIEYRQIPGRSGSGYDPLVRMELSYWLPDPEGVREIAKGFGGE